MQKSESYKVTSAYQASGPIFVRKGVSRAQLAPNELPTILHHRLLSIRVYDGQSMMIAAATKKGKELPEVITQLFSNPAVEYLQVHNAGPGCYNCQIDRV